jgi:hypothetical protein
MRSRHPHGRAAARSGVGVLLLCGSACAMLRLDCGTGRVVGIVPGRG